MSVFQKLDLMVGKGIGTFVASLLIEQLGFEEVGHARSAGAIIVAVEAEVFLSLLDAALGQL